MIWDVVPPQVQFLLQELESVQLIVALLNFQCTGSTLFSFSNFYDTSLQLNQIYYYFFKSPKEKPTLVLSLHTSPSPPSIPSIPFWSQERKVRITNCSQGIYIYSQIYLLLLEMILLDLLQLLNIEFKLEYFTSAFSASYADTQLVAMEKLKLI